MKLNKLILHLAIIIILSTIFTTVITHIYNQIYDNVGSIDSWINFFGAITGGLLTLYGVWWTLNEQQKQFRKNLKEQRKISNRELLESQKQFKKELEEKDKELILLKKQRKEDLALQYRPIFSLEFLNSVINNVPFENSSIICYLNLNNIGRGEATYLTFEYSKKQYPYLFMISCGENAIITQKNTRKIMVNILKIGKQIDKANYEISQINNNDIIVLNFTIKFKDSFDNEYSYTYNLSFEYNLQIDTKKIRSFSIKDGVPSINMVNPKESDVQDYSWKPKISEPQITFKLQESD